MTDDVAVCGPIAPRVPTRASWLAALIVAGFGGFLGYQAAYQSSLGGLGGALGAAFIAFGIGAFVVLAGLVGIGNALRPGGSGRVASRYAFAAAALLPAGAAVGYATVPVFDLGYHEPVVLEARGEASVTLEGSAAFEPRAGGRADCQSVANGTDVERVVALNLGRLNGNVLRADITLPVGGISGSAISIFVDAAHLPEGTLQPMWTAFGDEVVARADGTSGTIRFHDAPLQVDPKLGAPGPSWPAMLGGEVRWMCGAWFDPNASARPPVDGSMTLDATAADWAMTTDAAGICEFEPDGSVSVVRSDDVGLLRDRPLMVNLDLTGDPRRGDQVVLMVGVQEGDAPARGGQAEGIRLAATSGGPSVWWSDLVTLDEASDGELRGQLTFMDLPRQGTPDMDLPLTLSGTLTWECDQ